MIQKSLFFVGVVFLTFILSNRSMGQERKITNLNGKWFTIVDPYETGFYDYRYVAYDDYEDQSKVGDAYFKHIKPETKSDRIEFDFEKSETLLVPGDWNSQDDKLLYYEGTIWYKKTFNYPDKGESSRIFVRFGGANYRADVYLNGTKLGKHIGGFTPFSFDATDLIRKENNHLVVKVDNKRYREAVPTLNTDWWNYGGITRDVDLVEVATDYIEDFSLRMTDHKNKIIKASVRVNGPRENIVVSIPDLNIQEDITPGEDGFATFEIRARKAELWSPQNPRLYDVYISYKNDQIKEKMGFRTIETQGTDILLNGESIFLRGICIHEENPLRGGRAFNREDAEFLLSQAKDLNCNFVRLAHYPHNKYMAQVADSMGMLLWEEIPVYWTIQWENARTLENAKSQLTELIHRDINRASVIVWSVGNETPLSNARNTFMKSLVQHVRKMDDSRLISAAMEINYEKFERDTLIIDDPLGQHVDLLSYNEYIGWYVGLPQKCREITWEYAYEKPVCISELGAGALAGYHGDSLTRWSEEYQNFFYQEQIKMLEKIDQLRGTTPWILNDFRSPKRPLPYIQDGYNRKGLVSENGEKKQAYWTLREFYKYIENTFDPK